MELRDVASCWDGQEAVSYSHMCLYSNLPYHTYTHAFRKPEQTQWNTHQQARVGNLPVSPPKSKHGPQVFDVLSLLMHRPLSPRNAVIYIFDEKRWKDGKWWTKTAGWYIPRLTLNAGIRPTRAHMRLYSRCLSLMFWVNKEGFDRELFCSCSAIGSVEAADQRCVYSHVAAWLVHFVVDAQVDRIKWQQG